MPQSGQEMLDEAIGACREIGTGLGAKNQAWEDSIFEIVDKFDEISGTFFFKTMPAVPATRGTLREVSALLELRKADDWAGFEPALETTIKSAQDLIEKAGMKGVTLT